MEFQEKRSVLIGLFSTGATTEQVSPYYDMRDFRRADFIVSGLVQLPASGALGATKAQQFNVRVLQASNATGGGATAMSTATALVGKDSASGVSTSMKMREGRIFLSTMTSGAAKEVTVNGHTFTCATATSAAMQWACASGANATVGSEAFVTMFNATANNTATALTDNWQAATIAGAGAWVRIIPKDPDGTHLLTLGSTGGTQLGVGGVFQVHIGVETQYMQDGKRYLAVGVKSTDAANPFTVHVIREKAQGPANAVTYSKSINSSTSK